MSTKSNPPVEELRDLAAEVAQRVAREVGERRAKDFTWSTKSTTTDVVTEIDTWAEATVVELISAQRPDDGFLGEEGTNWSGTTGIVWVIDPVDGTTNLLYDIPGYSVSIGVERMGKVVAGAVADPIRDELFAAALGAGATKDGLPITVSKITELPVALLATGFAYNPDKRREQAQGLVEIVPEVRDIRRHGGAALDLCAVACGRVDAYFERGLSPWDSAAGTVIAREAGAFVERGMEANSLTLASAPGIAIALGELIDKAGA